MSSDYGTRLTDRLFLKIDQLQKDLNQAQEAITALREQSTELQLENMRLGDAAVKEQGKVGNLLEYNALLQRKLMIAENAIADKKALEQEHALALKLIAVQDKIEALLRNPAYHPDTFDAMVLERSDIMRAWRAAVVDKATKGASISDSTVQQQGG
ncbi:MAG: hypothetical protein C4542_09675 [Dehalococcoidia bacterium]|nr:MAG: hypothetical protein C4542_09675 [Dehalococcoidia bacterium]